MILSRAPLRISLAGGGSDLPNFYAHEFGEVLNFAINKYVYIAIHDYYSGGIRLSYSKTETVHSRNQIEHPLIKNVLECLNFEGSVEIGSFADVPGTGTGLGSSSAFTVALLNAILNFQKREQTVEYLALSACKVELEMCGDPIGKQDQYASAYGGIRRYIFNPDNSVNVIHEASFSDKAEFLNQSLLLYYTGLARSATTILQQQSDSLKNRGIEFDSIKEIKSLVPNMADAISNENVHALGQIVKTGWDLKKLVAPGVTNSTIDSMLERATSLGALSGKLVGAGGGGFLLLCVEPWHRKTFMAEFTELRQLPFSVSAHGAEIVYSDESEKSE